MIFINSFFQVQVYDRVGSAVGFHLLKYMKGQGNVSFWSAKKPKGYKMNFMAVKSRENALVLYFIHRKTVQLRNYSS